MLERLLERDKRPILRTPLVILSISSAVTLPLREPARREAA